MTLKRSQYYLGSCAYDKEYGCKGWRFVGPIDVFVCYSEGELVDDAYVRLDGVLRTLNECAGFGGAPEYMLNGGVGGDRPVGSEFTMPRVPHWKQDRDDLSCTE